MTIISFELYVAKCAMCCYARIPDLMEVRVSSDARATVARRDHCNLSLC